MLILKSMSTTALKLFISLFICHLSAYASDCNPSLTVSQFETLIENTKNKYYPELLDQKIIIKTFKSDSYFLQAKPLTKSILKNKLKRIYGVYLNLNLLVCPPETEALEAILAHELEHIVDYSKKTNLQIINQGLKFVTNFDYRTIYERQTDEKVLKKGFSAGLIKYRQWQYQRLNEKDLKFKKIIYYTPEEIDQWLKMQSEN